MGFTNHNNLETPDQGTLNWDSIINTNFGLVEKGPTVKATAGTTISINNVTYIDTSGKFQLAVASGITVSNRYIGLSTTQIDTDNDGFSQTSGNHKDADWSFDVGQPVYLSADTPGGLTTISPSDLIMVGFAIATNEIIIRPFSWIS